MNSWDLSIYRLPGVFAVRGGGGTAVFCLLPPHERDADTELLELVFPLDPYFSIDIPAVGVDSAHLLPQLLRDRLGADAINHGIDHDPGFRSQLLIGRQEQLIFLWVDLILSFLRQMLCIGFHLLHLPL